MVLPSEGSLGRRTSLLVRSRWESTGSSSLFTVGVLERALWFVKARRIKMVLLALVNRRAGQCQHHEQRRGTGT